MFVFQIQDVIDSLMGLSRYRQPQAVPAIEVARLQARTIVTGPRGPCILPRGWSRKSGSPLLKVHVILMQDHHLNVKHLSTHNLLSPYRRVSNSPHSITAQKAFRVARSKFRKSGNQLNSCAAHFRDWPAAGGNFLENGIYRGIS